MERLGSASEQGYSLRAVDAEIMIDGVCGVEPYEPEQTIQAKASEQVSTFADCPAEGDAPVSAMSIGSLVSARTPTRRDVRRPLEQHAVHDTGPW
jgi:hypothetical protein